MADLLRMVWVGFLYSGHNTNSIYCCTIPFVLYKLRQGYTILASIYYWSITSCHVIQYNTMQYNTVQHDTIQYYNTMNLGGVYTQYYYYKNKRILLLLLLTIPSACYVL